MLSITNGEVIQLDIAITHNQEGCVAHVNNSDPSMIIYSKLRSDNTPTFESEIDYTERQTMIQDGRSILNTENTVDFTNEGVNLTIDASLNDWKYSIQTGLEGSQFFFETVLDGNDVVATRNHLIYSASIENACLFKTQRYNYLIPTYLLADNTGKYILDSDGNYIITADWYR